MSLETDIPEHWGYDIIKDHCKVNQINRKPEEEFPERQFDYVTVSCVDGEQGKVEQTEKEIGEDAPSRAKREIRAGDVIVSTTRPYLRAFAIVPDELDGAICSTAFAVLTPGEDLLTKFLWYAVRFGDFVNQLKKKQRGASYPAVGIKDVKNSRIPVPPLEEQKVIVDKLDNIFESIGEIQDAQEQVEEIYQDIAFSFFTSRVRDAETDTVETEELIKSTQYGSSNATNSEGDGYPSLRMGNYNLRGEMDYSKIKYQDLDDDEFEKYRLEKGDVLFNRTNSKDLVGKMCIYDGGLEDAVFASYLIRVELNEDRVLPEYFVTYMNSHLGEVERQGKLKQAVSQANINATELREMEMAIPSLERQKEIVKSLNYMRSKVDDIKTEVDKKSKLIEDMPNSILAEAFKGNLVDFGATSESDELDSTEQGIREKQESSLDAEGQQSLGEYR
jgi:type I restriction enzyme S subunit